MNFYNFNNDLLILSQKAMGLNLQLRDLPISFAAIIYKRVHKIRKPASGAKL